MKLFIISALALAQYFLIGPIRSAAETQANIDANGMTLAIVSRTSEENEQGDQELLKKLNNPASAQSLAAKYFTG